MQTSTSAGPIDLTQFAEAINVALAEAVPCLIATCDDEGHPDIALKGSMMVFDRDHLAFWERSHGTTIENLQRNPYVAVLYRNRERKVSFWRFYGAAEVLPTGDVREQVRAKTVQAELDKDPDNRGIAVVIRIDRVLEPGRVLQQR